MTIMQRQRAAHDPRVPRPLVLGAIIAAFSVSAAGISLALAQESDGPTPEDIARFESEFQPPEPAAGGPDESAIERPQFEEPGAVPEEVRKQVPESDLVAVYCAMTRWKSGTFFAAMDAVEQLIVPAAEKLKDIGVSVSMPDPAGLRAGGEARVRAICQASSVDEADRLVREFMAWGRSAGDEKFASLRTDMKAKIQTAAEAMRAEIKAELDPYIEEQKAKITAEIEAQARSLADQKAARFADYTQPPSESEISALKAEITRELQSTIERKKAEVAAAVQAKVKEIAGTKQQKLEAAAGAFAGMEKKMNEAIRSGAAKYESYHEEAMGLRKKIVLDILDSSMEEGLKELDARAGDVEEARRSDPSVPSAADVRAQIAQSRQELEAKLDSALRSGDESAFQAALADFRVRWETYRTEMERAAKQSAGKICTVALAQFGQARTKMTSELGKLDDLEAKCAGSVTEECLKVNEFAPRFGTLRSSLSDIVLEMAVAEKMCASPDTADSARLSALMKKIQSDAEDVRVFGEALAVEKSKVIAASAAEICAQALPQLRAGRAEIDKNELAQMEAELARCKNTGIGLCADDKIPGHIARIKPLMASFLDGAAKAEALCQSPTEEQFAELRDLLNYLKGTGEKLRWETETMKGIADSYEKMSQKQLCGSILSELDIARQELSRGLAELAKSVTDCQGQEDGRCAIIARSSEKIASLQQKIQGTMSMIAEVAAECATAGEGEAGAAFIQKLKAIKEDGDAIKAAEAELRGSVDLVWPSYIKTHKPFKVVFDMAPSKFDDSVWTGDWRTDQMGTIRGGETYAVTYTADPIWRAGGYNEGSGAQGTWSYRAGDPDKFELNIWGRIYSFDDQGNVYDQDFGLVGHLVK